MRPRPSPARRRSPSVGPPGRLAWAVVALVLLVVLCVRIRLLDVPFERDEGEYAYAGQLILHGIPPYKLVYNMKLPGTYAAYALFLMLFGQTVRGVHLGLLVVNAGTIALLYLLARRLVGSYAGAVAAATYALLSVAPGVDGVFAHATHLVVLPALGGLLLLLRALESGRPLDYALGGVLLGLAFMMKQHGVFLGLFGGAVVVGHALRTPSPQRRLAALGAAFAAGAVLPFLLTCLTLAALGVFSTFWFWTVRYAAVYVSSLPLGAGLQNLQDGFTRVTALSLPLWGLALAGLGVLVGSRNLGPHRAFIAGFLLFSFLAMCPGLYFREHYFVLLLPPVALLAGIALDALRRLLATRGHARAARVVPGALFASACAVVLMAQAQFLFAATPREASRMCYGLNPFPEAAVIADTIAARAAPDDRIAIIGSEPEILFYANRLSATGHIYMYGLMEVQPYARVMQQQAIREIESSDPAWLVFVNVPQSWLMQPKSDLSILEWYSNTARKAYEPVGLVEILSASETAYTWGGDIRSHAPRSPYFLIVYRRMARS